MRIKNLKPSERLDFVLKGIQAISNNPRWEYFSAIVQQISWPMDADELNENNEQMKKIIKKLKENGFIDEYEQSGPGASRFMYSLTFEGEALLELEGGYSGRLEKEMRLKSQLEIEAEARRKNEKDLRRATWAAGIAAGLLLVWDIVEFSVETNSAPHYFFEIFFHLVILPIVFVVIYLLVRKLP